MERSYTRREPLDDEMADGDNVYDVYSEYVKRQDVRHRMVSIAYGSSLALG